MSTWGYEEGKECADNLTDERLEEYIVKSKGRLESYHRAIEYETDWLRALTDAQKERTNP